jgi:hypothetical protein
LRSGWSQRLPVEDGFQAGDRPLYFAFITAAGSNTVPQKAQLVQAGQEDVDNLPRYSQFPLAQQVQDALHPVGEGGHVVETHGGRRALQGMGGAKDGVQQV